MLLEQQRRDVCLTGRRLVAERLVSGAAGSISVRGGEFVVVTPSGVPLDRLEPADCPVLSTDGRVFDGRREPNVETVGHLAVHSNPGTDLGAAVFVEPEFATAVAATLPELPPVHHRALRLGGVVPVAPYTTYGTPDLADELHRLLRKGSRAVLLANHGAVTVGRDLDDALDNARLLEWLCALYVRGRALGEPRVLTEEELAEVARRDRYGWVGGEVAEGHSETGG